MSQPFLSPKLHDALLTLLDNAINVDGAAKGNLQLLDPLNHTLFLSVQRGFTEEFVDTFRQVRADEPTACGRALRYRNRVFIPDVRQDVQYQPYLSIAHASGYRAVQSTPIIGPDNALLGVFSTHFASAHRLSPAAEAALDNLAFQIAWVISEHSISGSFVDSLEPNPL